MSQIKKQGNGKYLVQVYDIHGKRLRKVFTRKYEADVFISKIESAKNDLRLASLNVKKIRTSFDEALNDFSNTKIHLRPKSIRKYLFVIKHFGYFIDALRLIYVDEFTSDHATLLYREIIKERKDPKGNTNRILKPKPKTVNFFLQTIRSFFRDEILKEHIKTNPMNHIKNLKVEKRRPDYYSETELKNFFSQEMNSNYRNAFLGFLYTGMRFGELANLTWDDVDLDKRLIFVKSDQDFKTKTENSERIIPLNQNLFDLICEIRENKLSDYVFTSPMGKKLRERSLLNVCKNIAKKAGIKSNAFIHKFRHTFGTAQG